MLTTDYSQTPAQPNLKPKSPVEFTRQEVLCALPLWQRIRAACKGQDAVKVLREKVLPTPQPGDISPEAQARYSAYLQRAVFYNVSGRTLEGLTGYVFAKEPTVNLPVDIEGLEENVDGAGVSLEQQAKACLRLILGLGRCGLLVDYPTVNGRITTKQDITDGKIAPNITLYEPEDIINWRTVTVGADTTLTMVVLRESYTPQGANEFESTDSTQYRVITVAEDGVITGRIFRTVGNSDIYEDQPNLTYAVVGKDGNPLEDIPFIFVGAVNNDTTVDDAPLADLVNLNMAHFCNSADYEESCFLTGQPTPWMAGLTQAWVDEVMKGQIQLGSRTCIPLPEGGSAGLLQANPNTLPMEAMKHKEDQMLAIGAKLVQPAVRVTRTATEVGIQHSAEVSVLGAAANNVFAAYRSAMKVALEFVGTGEALVEFELSEPLSEDTLDPLVAQALVATWQAGGIDFDELRRQLSKPGWAFKENDVVRAAVIDDGLRPTLPPTVLPAVPPKTGAPVVPPPPAPKPRPVK